MEMDILLSTIFTMRVSSRSLFSLSRTLCIPVRGSRSQACVIMPRGARVSAGFQPRAITVVITAKNQTHGSVCGAKYLLTKLKPYPAQARRREPPRVHAEEALSRVSPQHDTDHALVGSYQVAPGCSTWFELGGIFRVSLGANRKNNRKCSVAWANPIFNLNMSRICEEHGWVVEPHDLEC